MYKHINCLVKNKYLNQNLRINRINKKHCVLHQLLTRDVFKSRQIALQIWIPVAGFGSCIVG